MTPPIAGPGGKTQMAADHADFSYDYADAGPGARFAASIYANRAHVREEMREDAEQAGLSIRECGPASSLLGRESASPSDVVLLDCPGISAAGLDAVAQLDQAVARAGAQLVLSTTLDVLDQVYAACQRSEAQILVNPTRAERVVALGRVLVESGGSGVRELSEHDRLMLLRLTEQVGTIAQRLDHLGGPGQTGAAHGSADSGADWGAGEGHEQTAEAGDRPLRAVRAALPDPRLVRRIIQHRQRRGRYFDGELFADPAWDMLLDLTAARAEHNRVSVTSLCVASGVPATTALRWIGQMTKAGLLDRVEDDADKRRAFIALSDRAADSIARYFAEIGRDAAHLT